jgi:hypothetical protein
MAPPAPSNCRQDMAARGPSATRTQTSAFGETVTEVCGGLVLIYQIINSQYYARRYVHDG